MVTHFLKTNQVLQLTYPTSCLVEPSELIYTQRHIRVKKLRDLVADPLTVREYLNRPLVRRGRWLVLAYDLDSKQYRQFYLANSKEFAATNQLRIGLYKPGESKPVDVISRPFDDTRRDRIALARILKDPNINTHGLELRIFAPDLAVA